jgi:hypothetical protein
MVMDDEQFQTWSHKMISDQVSVRLGKPRPTSFEEVPKWADANGGELKVRQGLQEGLFDRLSESERVVWARVAEQERKRVDHRAAESLRVDLRAAQASERAARVERHHFHCGHLRGRRSPTCFLATLGQPQIH